MVMYRGEKDRYVIPKRFYGKGAKGAQIYSKLIANKPPTGQTSKAYEKMLYNEIHEVVAGVHGLTLVGRKRKREEVQTPAQEIVMNVQVPDNVCKGECRQPFRGGQQRIRFVCGHQFCCDYPCYAGTLTCCPLCED